MASLPPISLEPFAENFIGAKHGDWVRRVRNYPEPTNHFLLYIRDEGARLVPRRMWDYRVSDIAESEKWLFHLAKGPKPTPAYLGPGFIDMVWQFPCYITVVFDNDDFYFNFHGDWDNPDGQPILFVAEKFGQRYHPNHSFYNAVEVEIPVIDDQGNPTGPTRRAVRLTNHVKDENGNDIKKGDWRRYKMDLLVWKPTETGGGSTGHTLQYVDPDGQNQGPPNAP